MDEPEGGSLNHLSFEPHAVVKSYAGAIPRGYQKLYEEYRFLRELPPEAAPHFAGVRRYLDRECPRLVELHLERVDAPAVAKAILKGQVTPARTREIVSRALDVLLGVLYPLASATLTGADTYAKLHRPRMRVTLDALSGLPDIGPVIAAKHLRVNGRDCPPLAATLDWLDAHAGRWIGPTRVVRAHGDAHLDNMLCPVSGPIRVTFIDPRGTALLPPSYDFAKLLKAARTGYDRVHYGSYHLDVDADGTSADIRLAVDPMCEDHYAEALHVLLTVLPDYADAENVTPDQFRRAAIVAELAHVVSFSYFHANHPGGRDTRRVIAYLATSALLAARLMDADPDAVPVLDQPLPL